MQGAVIHNGEGEQLHVLGDHQVLRLTGAQTDGAYTLVEQVNEPGTGIPPHVHSNEDEVFHIVEGEVTFMVDGEAVVAGPGTSVFAPRGTPHGFQVTGDSTARVLLSIFPAGLEAMFRELAALPEGPPDFEKVTAICGRFGIEFLPPPETET